MQGLEQVAVHVDPGAHEKRRPAKGFPDLGSQRVHGVHVGDLEFQAGGDVALEPQQFLGGRDGDVGQGRVVFVHAGLEKPAQHEGLDLGREPGGAFLAGRRHEVDRLADDQP